MGSLSKYANHLIGEIERCKFEWHVLTPFNTSFSKGYATSSCTFLISKFQKEETEKEAYRNVEFNEELNKLETFLQNKFERVDRRKQSIAANFSKLREVDRTARENFAGMQVITLLVEYNLTIPINENC